MFVPVVVIVVVVMVVSAIVMVSASGQVFASEGTNGPDETRQVALKLVEARVSLAAVFVHVQFAIYFYLQ